MGMEKIKTIFVWIYIFHLAESRIRLFKFTCDTNLNVYA